MINFFKKFSTIYNFEIKNLKKENFFLNQNYKTYIFIKNFKFLSFLSSLNFLNLYSSFLNSYYFINLITYQILYFINFYNYKFNFDKNFFVKKVINYK